MKKIKRTGTVLLLWLLALQLSAQTGQPEQLTVPLSNPGKTYTLHIGILSGSIKVSGYPGKDIVIDVSTGDKSKKEPVAEEAGNGMKRIFPGSGYDVTATEDNNKVNISSSHNKHVILNVKIPQDVKLQLSTVNDGVIEVDNIKGELEINNVNGAIKLTGISGSAVASTVNGNVIASFITATDAVPMAFTTLNGNVDVTFPAGTKSNLKLRSDRGGIYTDFDIALEKAEQKVTRNTEAGMQQIKIDDWILGKINGGGAEIMMKNMNGNIYVRKSK